MRVLHLCTKLADIGCNYRHFKPRVFLDSIQSLTIFSLNWCQSRETSLTQRKRHDTTQGLLQKGRVCRHNIRPKINKWLWFKLQPYRTIRWQSISGSCSWRDSSGTGKEASKGLQIHVCDISIVTMYACQDGWGASRLDFSHVYYLCCFPPSMCDG